MDFVCTYNRDSSLALYQELQCSDWSQRPLTEEQQIYAAIDAHCLLEIFDIFQLKVDKEGPSSLVLDSS